MEISRIVYELKESKEQPSTSFKKLWVVGGCIWIIASALVLLFLIESLRVEFGAFEQRRAGAELDNNQNLVDIELCISELKYILEVFPVQMLDYD